MINALIESGGVDLPWPVLLPSGVEIPGRLGINSICLNKCTSKSCRNERSSLIGTRCALGLTVYEGLVDKLVVKVFGVVGPAHRESLPKHLDFKIACKGRSVSAREFSSWIQRLKEVSATLHSLQEKNMAEALEPLHDAMRLARDVAQLAEKNLKESATPYCADPILSASPTVKSLLKTSSLLVDSFDLLEIYLNPKAASYGQPRSIEIYKLIDKLAKIAGLARRQEKKPAVRLVGNTRRAFDLFESFKLIPIALIDNAQKYSRTGGAVDVNFSESGAALEISVTSEGAWLSPEELGSIFLRGFRGVAAKKHYAGGMGLGLYIAQTVARAHGFEIKAVSSRLGYDLDGIPQATNTFKFVVRDVGRR